MDVAFAFLADSAVVPPDRKLYILGGGFTTLTMPTLPGRATFAVVAGFRFTAADAQTVQAVEVRLVDAEGKLVVPPATLQFQAAAIPREQEEITVSTVTYMSPMFGEPGRYRVEYSSSERLLAGIGLTVVQPPKPGEPALGPRPN
jgi:hypothetical protein